MCNLLLIISEQDPLMFYRLKTKKGNIIMFNYKNVEAIIGYTFNNKKLLKQAFTRSGYAYENNCESNEVLEFIGDKVLDLAIINVLAEIYGETNKNGFVSNKTEGDLTTIKAEFVNTDSLFRTVERLRLSKYLLLGKGEKITRNNYKTINEDLFEAIFGAIALDCNWDMNIITPIAAKLLIVNDRLSYLDEDWNCVGQLQELLSKNGVDLPEYSYEQKRVNGELVWCCSMELHYLSLRLHAFGETKKKARQEVARMALHRINVDGPFEEQNNTNIYRTIIGEPSFDNSLQQINMLVQLKAISKPNFEFDCEYNEDGDPIWLCKCTIKEVKKFYFTNRKVYSNTKKAAQKSAALALLEYLVEEE